jgi:hypothetical protein
MPLTAGKKLLKDATTDIATRLNQPGIQKSKVG